MQGLATYQAADGEPTTVLLPLYRSVRETGAELVPEGDPFTIQVGPHRETVRLLRLKARRGPRVLFLEHNGFYDRSGLYGEGGEDYPDNALRFACFSYAAVTALDRLADPPVVLHAHDWHTALAPVYARTILAGDELRDHMPCVLSVHNAGFQGHFDEATLDAVGLPGWLWAVDGMEWYGKLNLLKGGLKYSDAVTTVSPTHAYELRTEVGGFGLTDMFIGLRDRLTGILNGIDQKTWDPATDPLIPAHFTASDLSGKDACKAALQRSWNLPVNPGTPVFGMSARLVSQKGLDLVLGGESLRQADAQFVFLGAGEARYEETLRGIATAMPDRVAAHFVFTDEAEHELLAGADFLLMPSLYEPCGLTQMRAQRYGALPIGRRVGGLADTIQDEVTGFLFDDYTPAAFDVAVRRALALFADRPARLEHARIAMGRDFGWERSVERYLEVYERALAARS